MKTIEELVETGQRVITLAKKHGASAADTLVLESVEASAGIRDGEPETIERAESVGLGLRVFVGKASANLSTSDLSETTLTRLVERAIAIARAAPPDPFSGLADPSLLAKRWGDFDLVDLHEPDMASLQATAKRAEAAAVAVEGITNSEGANAGYDRHVFALVTSDGFHGGFSSSRHAVSVSVIAGEDDEMERDYEYRMATHASELPAAEVIGRIAAERTIGRMNPRKLTSREAPIFFEPRVAKSLLSALAGGISGSAIARGTSFLKEALNTQLFNEGITIIDDPHRPRALGSRPFDAEGVVTAKRAFIDHGVLTSWMLDTRSANQLGLTTTGNALRGLSGAPHPATSNFYLAPGKLSRDDLYRSVPNGLLVTETIGHGANLITGDYSLGASGFWIENGEIAYPVSEVTIASNLKDMFRTLVAADDLEFRGSTNSPTLLIPRMTIAGN